MILIPCSGTLPTALSRCHECDKALSYYRGSFKMYQYITRKGRSVSSLRPCCLDLDFLKDIHWLRDECRAQMNREINCPNQIHLSTGLSF